MQHHDIVQDGITQVMLAAGRYWHCSKSPCQQCMLHCPNWSLSNCPPDGFPCLASPGWPVLVKTSQGPLQEKLLMVSGTSQPFFMIYLTWTNNVTRPVLPVSSTHDIGSCHNRQLTDNNLLCSVLQKYGGLSNMHLCHTVNVRKQA